MREQSKATKEGPGRLTHRKKPEQRSSRPEPSLPGTTQLPNPRQAPGSDGASGRTSNEASGGWDSSCLAAAAADAKASAPSRNPQQVCLSSAALDSLDPAVDLSA